ncbi:MAG: TIGR03986 family CRISPR-associated RAMP protein [Eubacteriales bacterium]|nr:TIGR03986 family CRISPR-associated RAMP protein [Eubacteriales bacterium]
MDDLDLSELQGWGNILGKKSEENKGTKKTYGNKKSSESGNNGNKQSGKTGNHENKQFNGGGNKYSNRNVNKQSSGNINKRSNRNANNRDVSSYVGAPYNFVPFSKKVVPVSDKDMLVRGIIDDELLSGEITYSVKAETPIFIDDGRDNHEFYRNVYDEYAIPGSTVRGLFRAHAQILGVSGFNEDIEDYRLMYRKVGARSDDPDRDRYNEVLGNRQVLIQQKPISVLKHVRGGYIKNEGGKYYLYPTGVKQICSAMGEMNYYVLSERHIQARGDDPGFAYFKKHKEILQHDLSKEFKKEWDRSGRLHYKGTPNPDYVQRYYKVSYEVKNLRNIVAVGEPGKYKKEGYLVFTGKMNEKKAIYIIPEMVEEGRIQIPEADVKAYLIDFKKKETTLRTFGGADKFALPKEGQTRPVFYIELEGRLYFGYTPRLRLFYDHTIKEGYKQENADGFDMVKSMFGCTGDKESFKSKVSFSDAVLQTGNPKKEEGAKVVLGEPKPSSYRDYLEQSKGKDIVTYNHDFTLRGVKQYWLRDAIVQGGDIKNKNVGSEINALSAGNIFHGKIRFQNLTKEELGLLLWCVRLEKNSQVNIGKAKAYGYGRCSISDVSLQILNHKKAYGLSAALDLSPFDKADVNEYINTYQKAMSEKLHRDITATEPVKTFFMMKDATIMPDADRIRYMSIDAKEYQKRGKNSLQKPGELVKRNRSET